MDLHVCCSPPCGPAEQTNGPASDNVPPESKLLWCSSLCSPPLPDVRAPCCTPISIWVLCSQMMCARGCCGVALAVVRIHCNRISVVRSALALGLSAAGISQGAEVVLWVLTRENKFPGCSSEISRRKMSRSEGCCCASQCFLYNGEGSPQYSGEASRVRPR